MKSKIYGMLGLLLVWGTSAMASSSVAEVSTSSTSSRTWKQAAGVTFITCSVDTRFKAGTAGSVTVTSTDPIAKAGQMTPVSVTEGQAIALKTNAGPGRCYLNRFESLESDPSFDDVTADAISATSLDLSGELVVNGDAGFKGNIDLDGAQVTGLARNQNLFLDGADAGLSSVKVKNLEITGTCTGCVPGDPIQWWGDGGVNNLQATAINLQGDVTGIVRNQNMFLDGADAGLNDVRARYFRTSSSQLGVGTTIGGDPSNGYASAWLGIAAGSESLSNYALLGGAAIGSTVLNAPTGQTLAFRINNANLWTGDSTGLVMASGKTITAVDIHATSTKTVGNITMTGGSGTATVNSGAICVCSDTSATPADVRCTVSSTTLTAAGTDGHIAAYICL